MDVIMYVLAQSVQRSTAPTVFALAAIYDHPLAARNVLKTLASGFAVSPGSRFFPNPKLLDQVSRELFCKIPPVAFYNLQRHQFKAFSKGELRHGTDEWTVSARWSSLANEFEVRP